MQFIRKKIGGTRRRMVTEDFDVDLTYICQDRIIVMSFPASGVKKLWRNNYIEVARYLNKFHYKRYWVFNCSEHIYDADRFDFRVSNYNW